MGIVSLMAGVMILLSVILKSFAVKVAVNKGNNGKGVSFASSFYLVLILLLTLPFMRNLLIPINKLNMFAVGISAVKGVLLFFSVRYVANIAKESNSSAVFAGYISLGVGAVLNFIFLKENLTYLQLVGCLALSILGTIFFFRGAASELSKQSKIEFILVTLIIIILMAVDKISISKMNWYMHLVINSCVYFLVGMFNVLKNKDYRKLQILKNKEVMLVGVTYIISEFFIIASMQYYLSVSMVNLFLRLSAPIIMVMSSYIYNERTPKEQLLFGILAFLFASPLFLFK